MDSAGSLPRGGQSVEPAVVAGRADASPLILFATDQVEDLEMSPLGKRGTYPPLTLDQIDRIKAWINGGAPRSP